MAERLTQRELGYLSNEALAEAPGQDVHLASIIYWARCTDLEREAAMEKVMDQRWEESFGEGLDDDIYADA